VLLVCTITMLIPRTAVLGCILVTGYLGGAVATQVRVNDAWFMFRLRSESWHGSGSIFATRDCVRCWPDGPARLRQAPARSRRSALEALRAKAERPVPILMKAAGRA
jgi:hypothetical protein